MVVLGIIQGEFGNDFPGFMVNDDTGAGDHQAYPAMLIGTANAEVEEKLTAKVHFEAHGLLERTVIENSSDGEV